jgi:hypothetical protein
MKLSSDLQDPKWIHAKGWLFALIALLAAGLILLELRSLRIAALLATCVWASCRFYYYLFYVLERYLGREQKFAGVGDALSYLWRLWRRG